ncbi:MAG: LysR family transcriptional regulator [Bacillota bacterium]|nr:LysR family transcriptional regulator [Bacillota bacterium]
MNVTSLEYFREIVEAKSITKVAANRHISQSALSQNIQKLEDEFQCSLLERSNKGVYPTEAGRVLFRYAGTMLRVMEKLRAELESLSNRSELVRITGYPSLVEYSLPCMLYKVKKKYLHYHFEMRSRMNSDAIHDLVNDIADLCFVSERPLDADLVSEHIGTERIVLVASRDSAVPATISAEELTRYDMILLDDDLATISSFIRAKLEPKGVAFDALSILFKVDAIPAAKSSVHNNMGLCFLLYASVKKEIYDKEFRIVEVRDVAMDLDVYLVAQPKAARSKVVEDVFRYFKEHGADEFC